MKTIILNVLNDNSVHNLTQQLICNQMWEHFVNGCISKEANMVKRRNVFQYTKQGENSTFLASFPVLNPLKQPCTGPGASGTRP